MVLKIPQEMPICILNMNNLNEMLVTPFSLEL